MRVVVAFDFAEEDIDEVISSLNSILENCSSKTLVKNIYDSDKYEFSEEALMKDLDRDFLLGALLDRVVNITGNVKDYPDKLRDTLDIEIFIEALSPFFFDEAYGG